MAAAVCGGAPAGGPAAGDAHGSGASPPSGGCDCGASDDAGEIAEDSESACGEEALEDADKPDEYVDFAAEYAPDMVRSYVTLLACRWSACR